MADLKVYSVLIAWHDSYEEMGDYGDMVRARDARHAERIVRARMIRNQWAEAGGDYETKREAVDLYRNDDGSYFGRLLDCHEGAIWKAGDLEKALRLAERALIAAYGEPTMPEPTPLESRQGREAILAARAVLAEIDTL